MLILKAYGAEIPCDRVEKGVDSITVYLDGQSIREDSGIPDFSGYSLTDENGNPVEFSEPEMDAVTQLQLAMAELYEGVLGNG